MRKVGLSITLLALAAAALTSCSDDNRPDFYNGTGVLYINIEPVAPVFAHVATPDLASFSLTMSSAEGATHTWDDFNDFEQGNRYIAGAYTFSATAGSVDSEGFDAPCYTVTTEANIVEGQRNDIVLKPTMYSTMVSVNRSATFNAHFSNLYFHALNGSYLGFEPDEKRIAYLLPGSLYIAADVAGTESELTILLAADIACESASWSAFYFDFDEETQTVTVARRIDNRTETTVSEFVLTREMLESKGPEVSVAETELSLPELTLPPTPAIFTIDSQAEISHINLTVLSGSKNLKPLNGEVDLLNPTEAQKKVLDAAGMKPVTVGSHFTIDISPLIALLTYSPGESNKSTFTVEIIDKNKHINRPVSLTVNTLPISLRVVDVAPIILGVNTTTAIIEAPDADPAKYLSVTGRSGQETAKPLEILDIAQADSPGRWNVKIAVPDGTDPVTLGFYYHDTLKETVTVNRVAPEYSIAVDAFATQVKIKVTTTDKKLRETLVERMTLFINGSRVPAFSRNTSTGIITIIGLTPSTSYTLETGISDVAASSKVGFVTEAVVELPNGDFEDTKHTIDYKDLLSGGLYSQTFAEIYNNQNRTSVSVFTPTKWANTNSKTFCESSKNKNSWYMQPSVVGTADAKSGDFAVELRSVGFDPNGEKIPPYLQESRPFVGYSRNVPDIKYRAAGRIFLGSYLFNPLTATETYVEGIPFTSRPATLSGFYRYTPSVVNIGDRGAVSIEVLDASDRVIGSGKTQLSPATSYTAFNVQLTYSDFGVKAAKLRIMASSSDVDPSIDIETKSVITYSDPSTSSSIGSVLTIDNFTLAY